MTASTSQRQAILDRIGKGPGTLADFASCMVNVGVEPCKIYFAARMALNELLSEGHVEESRASYGVCYRLPAKAKMEPCKDP